MRRTILNTIGFLLPIALWLLPLRLAAQEVQWRGDYATARREAAEKGRLLLLDFGTDHCRYCKLLDDTTFRDPSILGLMNERFIPLKVQADRESGRWLANNLQVDAYPTLVLAASDGKILDVHKGYMDAGQFFAYLQRALASVADPEWMVRDYQDAAKAVQAADYAPAISRLKKIVEDDSVKDRPVQARARQMLQELEKQAASRLSLARQLADKGQTSEAIEAITTLVRVYNGTQASAEGGKLLASLASNVIPRSQSPAQPSPSPSGRGQGEGPRVQAPPDEQRVRRARELLAQAREDLGAQQYLCCLERLEMLATTYADLPEGSEAMELSLKIKKNPEWMLRACETLSDRLGMLYLSLAETWLQRGQPQQAVLCLEKILQSFPGSQQAELAQIRLSQIQGQPTRPVDFKKP